LFPLFLVQRFAVVGMQFVRERDRRSQIRREFHYLLRVLQLAGFVRQRAAADPRVSNQFVLSQVRVIQVSQFAFRRNQIKSFCL